MQAPSPKRRACPVLLLLLLPLLAPTGVADAAGASYDLSLGAAAPGANVGVASQCPAEDTPGPCLLLDKTVGDPSIGGAAFATDLVRGRTVRAEAADAWSHAPPVTLALDVDGDGCAGCTDDDIAMQGCAAVDGIVLHTTRGDAVSVLVHTLRVDPTTGETCLGLRGQLRLSW